VTLFSSIFRRVFCLGGVAIILIPIQAQNPSRVDSAPAAAAAESIVRAQTKNIDFHLTDRIIVHIATLDGHLASTHGSMPVFDDKESFALDVDSANISVSTEALSNDLNDFVFSKPGAPLRKLSVTTRGNELVLKGLLSGKGDIPFETDGTLTATADGRIRVHAVKVRALHLPVKGLMDMLGLDIAKMIDTRKVNGVSTEKDDLILDPQQLLPPPQMRGHLTSIQIEDGEIVLLFENPEAKGHRPVISSTCGGRNFQSFKGGAVRFGKITMNDADLELIDSDPTDPFDFSIDHYKEQLVAGYSKMTRQGGLCVHMPDYSKIKQNFSSKH
jgi:hypothetical protein